MTLRSVSAAVFALAFCGAAAGAPGDPYCTIPGEQVIEDAADDAGPVTGTVPVEQDDFHDITSLSAAEPLNLPGKIAITMKVAALDPEPAPQSMYQVSFILSDGVEYFVAWRPYVYPTRPNFTYGHIEVNSTTSVRTSVSDGPAEPESTFSADGTITWVLDKSKIPGMVTGSFMTTVTGFAYLIVGAPDSHPVQPPPPAPRVPSASLQPLDETEPGFYELRGNESCAAQSKNLLAVVGGPLNPLLLAGLLAGAALRRRFSAVSF